jgi:arabinose-5-phosphate isomerase
MKVVDNPGGASTAGSGYTDRERSCPRAARRWQAMSKMSTETAIASARSLALREAQAVAALAEQFDQRLLQIAQILLDCRGHVLVAGAGTSAAVAQRFAHLLSCCGTPALYISAADGLHGGAGAITANDVVFLISKGGRSAEINEFAGLAHGRGATVVVQTEAPDAPLARTADAIYAISTAGDVDLFGMIALGSSLVNCAAGDALCALLLEMRGHTREAFAGTHPGGAVGRKIAGEKV